MRTLAFDLDDTLYDELDYVRSGLAWVARRFAGELGHGESELVSLFERLLAADGRQHIFNRALSALDMMATDDLIKAMVSCYRSQQPDIALYTGVEAMLEQLRSSYRLVLVTDGLPIMQRNKVASLDIEHYFDRVIYCWDYEAPKPDSTGYRLAIGDNALSEAVIVGDHPTNDGRPARELSIPFIRVMSDRFADIPGGDVVVQSVTELPEVLARV